MSRFFIERPIFAAVIAIIVALIGLLAILRLPIAQYPDIAPPAVSISGVYPGASAQTVESSVTQVIEQQLTGLDHLIYFSSISSSDGQVQITATFAPGTNADIAQVQVQNKLQEATPLLPAVVQQQGLTVSKSNASFLLIVAIYDTSGRYNNIDLGDYLNSYLAEPIERVDGVGAAHVFGGQYAMRIWLEPFKLQQYALTPTDIETAIQSQNVQVAAGQLGAQPAPKGQELNATVSAQSLLTTPDQFKQIVVKTQPDGSVVRLSDVANVEMGADNYQVTNRLNGHEASGLAVQLAPGANALKTADLVKAKALQLAKNLPPGIKLAFPVDSTTFIKLSIKDVVITLFEALGLVILVMFIFLQDWRVTLIPAIAVPVVLLGTFGVLSAFGYSINTLTMFAMVLAIGLLVDDAIVVVENVERIMSSEGLSPKQATIRSMGEITGALVGIALVLSAVFLPMAFFGGSTGVIYRQFSVTIVTAMILSVLVALILTPALCAAILRPIEKGEHHTKGLVGWFNRRFDRTRSAYQRGLAGVVGRPLPSFIVYGVILGVLAILFVSLPSSFLPVEDQGELLTQITLPTGAEQSRTVAVARQVEHYYLTKEKNNVDALFTVTGFSFAGQGQNQGMAFLHLSSWSKRKGSANSAQAIAERANHAFSNIRDARIFALVPPAVRELGRSAGFDLELEDRAGVGHEALMAAAQKLVGMAGRDPILSNVRINALEDTPQLKVDVNRVQAGALGLSISNIYETLTAAWGGLFVNNFVDRGRVKRVFMQGDPAYASSPQDLSDWFVRGSTGAMTPFSAFATSQWAMGPAQLQRYNGSPAIEIQGQPATGKSSGAAMTEMEKLVGKLGRSFGYEWTAISYQERLSGSQAPALYGISILVVFLCLAALYESWSIPFSVLLVIPLGIVGALLAATLRGFYNDVYFQVALLTTIGLSAKNAILIVQFADEAEKRGESERDAAREAARLRFRPIVMTSLAFVAGVFPLAISSGAGAASQNDLGTGVIGGMISATILAIFYVPLFYLEVRRIFGAKARARRRAGGAQEADAPG